MIATGAGAAKWTGACLAALLALAAVADEPIPRTVTVTFVEKDAPARGVRAEEVAVLENGVARPVVALVPDERPWLVAILVDSSQPQQSNYRLTLVEAVTSFVHRLPEGARYALWTTGDRPVKVVDFTDDRGAAGPALRRVAPQGGNRALDAIVEASRDLRAKEGQRAALVVVTGTGVGFSDFDRRQVVDEAGKGLSLFLGVQVEEGRGAGAAEGDATAIGPADYDYVLARLAEKTGGRRDVVLSPMAVPRALDALRPLFTAQYRLTYEPLGGKKERKVKVQVARPGVEARIAEGS